MLEKDVEVFEILSNPLRIRILQKLILHKNLIVSMLVEELGESQPLISHHLKLMTQSGLIMCIPCAQYRNYVVNINKIKELKETFEQIEIELNKKENSNVNKTKGS